MKHACGLQQANSVTRIPLLWVNHSNNTSRSFMRLVTEATRIRCLNCPGRSEAAWRVVIRALCQDWTRIGMILRESVGGSLQSLLSVLPRCARKMATHLSLNQNYHQPLLPLRG